MQDMELKPQRAGRRLHASHEGVGNRGAGRVDEHGNVADRRQQLVQHLQSLRPYLYVEIGHARHVAAGSI
jgi:hypothetical protein